MTSVLRLTIVTAAGCVLGMGELDPPLFFDSYLLVSVSQQVFVLHMALTVAP